MESNIRSLLDEILIKISPSLDEEKEIQELAEWIQNRLRNELEKMRIQAEIRMEGSVAKNTWISGDPDIDIFMLIPINVSRDFLRKGYLEAAKRATDGYEQIERYAEHPYLECIIKGVRVNIVPCYKVRMGKWKSATDRTPYHTDYLKNFINKKLSGEIRLLKKFMKSIRTYGAEIKIGGFSGYLCELLILNYGSFEETLRSAANWRFDVTIDLEDYYADNEKELGRFREPLVVIDPVDRKRNVAAAVRENKLSEFIAASRRFIDNPNIEFFYPTHDEAISVKELLEILEKLGSTIIIMKIETIRIIVPDILWGRIRRITKNITRLLKESDFNVIRSCTWSDERKLSILVFELDSLTIPPIKKHLGPPIDKRDECERFLKKHIKSKYTISGPRIEGNRWVVERGRKMTKASDFLIDKLNCPENNSGLSDLLSWKYLDSIDVLVNDEIQKSYSSIPEFALFFTDFLKGKPNWLK